MCVAFSFGLFLIFLFLCFFLSLLKKSFGCFSVSCCALEVKNHTQNVINSAFGKDRKISNHGKEEYKPDYKFIQKAIKNNKIVYVNKEKSVTLADTIRGSFPLGSDVSNALSDFIVSPQMQTVKTENDLIELQGRFTNLYQFEQEVFTQAEEVRKQYTNADGTMKEGWHKAPNEKDSNLTENNGVLSALLHLKNGSAIGKLLINKNI